MKGVTDRRSPIVKAIGSAVATKDVVVERGRLAGQTFTVRSLPTRVVQQANDEARQHLVDVRGWSEQRLYDADNVEKSADKSDRDLEAQLHILALALVVKPEADAPTAAVATLFAGPEELALTLEPEEVMHLFTEWHRFQVERSSLTRADTAEEVEAFVDSLGKGVTPLSRLSSCEPATLLATAYSMGLKLRSLTKPPSSATSPSNAPSDGSSPPSDSETGTMTIETSVDASTR
jgi:hypothetical protein